MKKMITLIVFLVAILMLLTTLLLALTASNSLFSKNPRIFSHTKAICTETNFCQDYEIHCENEKITGISPITGAVIQFPKNWEDPRDEITRNKLC